MIADDDKHPVAPEPAEGRSQPEPPRSSFRQTLNAVLWGFLGIRKRRDLASDSQSINPVHLIAMGVGLAAIFVACLVLLVRFITR